MASNKPVAYTTRKGSVYLILPGGRISRYKVSSGPGQFEWHAPKLACYAKDGDTPTCIHTEVYKGGRVLLGHLPEGGKNFISGPPDDPEHSKFYLAFLPNGEHGNYQPNFVEVSFKPEVGLTPIDFHLDQNHCATRIHIGNQIANLIHDPRQVSKAMPDGHPLNLPAKTYLEWQKTLIAVSKVGDCTL